MFQELTRRGLEIPEELEKPELDELLIYVYKSYFEIRSEVGGFGGQIPDSKIDEYCDRHFPDMNIDQRWRFKYCIRTMNNRELEIKQDQRK